jgi:DNA repair protein RecN (Recombination protein N)
LDSWARTPVIEIVLLELEVKGFALVDHLVLEFGDGLTVLTGETGAGKSIILDSLSFLLGTVAKGQPSECRVAGRFQPTESITRFLEEQGLPVDDGELLIVRERKSGGRTSSRLNGSLVSVNQLKGLSGLLVDLHGQHQSYALTRPSSHLPMLDRMAGAGHHTEIERYRTLYGERLALQRDIQDMQKAERDRLREIEWLKLELEEIDKVSPTDGELHELEGEIKRRAASEDLALGCATVLSALGDDGGALDELGRAISSFRPLPHFDESLQNSFHRLENAEIEIREVFREMSEYTERIEHDSTSLDGLQQRAESLKTLCRKYGPTLGDVLQHRTASVQKLERLENSDLLLQELQEKDEALRGKLAQSAEKLSRNRRKAAGALGTELVAELSLLAMPKVAFQVEFVRTADYGPSGFDQAQFLFSPNPGRAPTPLAETASGGELSRVMLALVSILSRFQKQPTLIFDEIDAGLGGRTAEAVASRLARLAKTVQVLCVTHLPVVAAAATGHYVVEKRSEDRGTSVSVVEVKADRRVEEVARMLSGDASKRRARELAMELLASHV